MTFQTGKSFASSGGFLSLRHRKNRVTALATPFIPLVSTTKLVASTVCLTVSIWWIFEVIETKPLRMKTETQRIMNSLLFF